MERVNIAKLLSALFTQNIIGSENKTFIFQILSIFHTSLHTIQTTYKPKVNGTISLRKPVF